MSTINLDYSLAISQAKSLESAANRCREMSLDINRQVDMIQGSWKGKSSIALCDRLVAWSKEMRAEEANLCKLAVKIRNKADLLKQIDEEEEAPHVSKGGGFR